MLLYFVVHVLILYHPLYADPVDGFINDDINLDEMLEDIPRLDITQANRDDIAGLPFFDIVSARKVIAFRDSLGSGDSFYDVVKTNNDISSIQREILQVVFLQKPERASRSFSGRIRSGYIHKPEKEAPVDGRYYTSINTAAGDNFTAGMVVDRDPFETRALDLISFHSSITFDSGRTRIILGDFRPGFGQNLVFSRYTRSYIDGLSVMAREPRRLVNTQFEEASFLRGAHVSVNRGPVKIQAWGSSRALDATLDAAGNAVTIRDSGIHETGNNRSNLDENLFSGRVSCQLDSGISLGLTGVTAEYTPSLARKDGERYLNDHSGSRFRNISVDAAYAFGNVTAFLEHAGNPGSGRATAGGIQIREHGFGASVAGREYSPQYWAPRSTGISSFGKTANEKGIYSAVQADLPGGAQAMVTMDHARLLSRDFSHAMPISRRRISCMLLAPGRGVPLWKIVVKSVDDSDSTDGRWNGRFHIQTPRRNNRRWNFEGIAAWSESGGSGGPCVEWRAKIRRYGCICFLSTAVFDIPSYASRFYRYEHNVPGRGMSQPVWGKGVSFICVVRFGFFSIRYRYADADMMAKSTELTFQSDVAF